MKKLLAGFFIVLVCCVSPMSVDAQQRDGGVVVVVLGIAEQRSYRGRQQRRRYHGGRYEWYEDPSVGRAIGGLLGGWLRGQKEQATRPGRDVQETDEAVLEPWSKEWFDYCKDKYKSFNPKDGRYLSFDGNRYFCKSDDRDD